MPTRKKQTAVTEQQPVNADPNTTAAIGRIEARLDGQEATDERIENTLTQLMRDHNEERKNSAVQFGEIGKQVAKIGVVLEESVKANKTIIENQNQMIGRMNDIQQNSQRLELQQNEFHKLVEEHLSFSATWVKDIEHRIHKLETTKYVWYVVGCAIMALLCAASYIATVFGVFKQQ